MPCPLSQSDLPVQAAVRQVLLFLCVLSVSLLHLGIPA